MRGASSRRGLTLSELLVIFAIIGVLLAIIVPAVQYVREAAHRAQCAHNLHQVGLALHQYHGSYGRLPPGISYQGGLDPQPFMSWQARLLPFLEREDLWRTTLDAYLRNPRFLIDPPHVGLSTALPVYLCPSDGRTEVDTRNGRIAFTSYLGVEGVNQFRRDGVLYVDSRTRLTEVYDGLSGTLFVGERPPSADGGFGWWYAGEGQSKDGSGDTVLGVNELNVNPAYGPGCPRGPYHFTAGDIRNQCDAYHFWSHHPGGAHFLFGDGGVRFLKYSANDLMPALATRAAGEAVELPE